MVVGVLGAIDSAEGEETSNPRLFAGDGSDEAVFGGDAFHGEGVDGVPQPIWAQISTCDNDDRGSDSLGGVVVSDSLGGAGGACRLPWRGRCCRLPWRGWRCMVGWTRGWLFGTPQPFRRGLLG